MCLLNIPRFALLVKSFQLFDIDQLEIVVRYLLIGCVTVSSIQSQLEVILFLYTTFLLNHNRFKLNKYIFMLNISK